MRRRIYIAAPYPRRNQLIPIAHELLAMGHFTTCRWLFVNEEDSLKAAMTREERTALKQMYAVQDLNDVKAAEIVLSFTEDPDNYDVEWIGRGGRHVEFGFGYILKKELVIVGKNENIFHSLPDVLVYPDWDAAKEYFAKMSEY